MSEVIAPSTAENLRFDYIPRPGLFKLCIVNFLLGIITLSIYRFWAKTNVRKHIWSSIHINGEPLEYTGTGRELFLGALMVFLALVLPLVVVTALAQVFMPLIIPLIQGIAILFIYVMWGYALYKARKFQLTRTNWRGIRGTLVGSPMIYSLTYFGSMMASGMSLGWATPVMNTVLQEQIISDMRFGDAAFKFKGKAGPLYPTFALCWFLTLAAFIALAVVFSGMFMDWFGADINAAFAEVFDTEPGISPSEDAIWIVTKYILLFAAIGLAFFLVIPMTWAIYVAKELRTFANYTRFDGAQFKLDATTGGIIWLTVINLLLTILTLNIAQPYVQQRTMRYVIDRLTLVGAIDIDRIRQSQVPVDKRGEGFADAFDVGGI
jgi:uncharacterized membrane protein YjgN (DUF898 family)